MLAPCSTMHVDVGIRSWLLTGGNDGVHYITWDTPQRNGRRPVANGSVLINISP